MEMRVQNDDGFTVLELMIALSIMIILMVALGTGMAQWLPNYRFNTHVVDIQEAVQNARIEAVKNNADVFVQLGVSNNQVQVFLDNADGSANEGNLDAGDRNISTLYAPNGVEYTDLFGALADPTQFAFNNRGISSSSGDICLKNSEETYKGVRLTLAGSSRIIRSDDGGNTWY